jgi:hypothetical protein
MFWPFKFRVVGGFVLVALALLLVPATLAPPAWGQAPPIQWIRQFSGIGSAVAVADSGVYAAGSVFDYNGGAWDAYVRKYDTSGNEIWTRQFGSAAYDLAQAVAADSTGVYVAGFTAGALPGQTSGFAWDAFIRKYDPNGNEVWTRQYNDGVHSSAFALAIAVEAAGVYVAGYSEDAVVHDVLVRKYDTSGNFIWQREFGTGPDDRDQAYAIAANSTGIYVVGTTEGALAGPNAGFRDGFVRKYDASGNEQWTRQFGTVGDDLALAVALNGSGVYVAGHTLGANSWEVRVYKYDTNGNPVWTRQFDTPTDDFAYGLAADSTGVYVAGHTGVDPPNVSDFYVRKYDPSGTEMWMQQVAHESYDFAFAIAVDSSGLYVTGRADSPFPGETSQGAFVAKLGNVLSVATIYLRGIGPSNNPPTLFLDAIAPTNTTAKFKDSTAINFNGGNLWKEVGVWPAEPSLTSGSLTALGDLRVWLGLKNSDDQGTNFDLRVEVSRNGALVAAGETYCIQGVTRNANLAKEVLVSFAPFAPVTFNGATDELSLKVLTRIGSNGAGGFCGGHSNAVGLRLYFDSVSRPSRFNATTAP